METLKGLGIGASFIPLGYLAIDTIGDLVNGRKNALQATVEIAAGIGVTALCLGQVLLRTDPDNWKYSPVSGVTDFDYRTVNWEDVKLPENPK
jgi:hypothetical protein